MLRSLSRILVITFLLAGVVIVSNIKAIPQNETQKSDESKNENPRKLTQNAGLASFVPLTQSGYKLAIRFAAREDLRKKLAPLYLKRIAKHKRRYTCRK